MIKSNQESEIKLNTSKRLVTVVTGGSGRLGKAFKKLYPDFLYPSRTDMDLAAGETIVGYFEKLASIDYLVANVIHLAAMTGIPQCESNQAQAYNINVEGTRTLARTAFIHNPDVHFIYLNTACIFSGERSPDGELENIGYSEKDIPYPKNYYGMTKLMAEESLRSIAQTCGLKLTITRTNFTCMPWEYPKAFTDRFGTYLFAQGVAKGIIEIANLSNDEKILLPEVIHLCGDVKLSMYDYAKLGGSAAVQPMTLADYTGKTPLTRNMCLITKNWKTHKIQLSDYNDN